MPLYAAGSTSVSIDVQIVDDSGLAVTGLVASTFPTMSWSLNGNTAATAFPTLNDLSLITTAYNAGGVKERSAGFYRLDLPNTSLTTAGEVTIIGDASGKHVIAPRIQVGATVTQDMGQVLPASPVANSVGEALVLADITGGRVNVAQAGSSTTITLDAAASANAAAYIGDEIYLYGGTGGGARGSGQRRTVIAYNSTTKVATVNRAWDTTPDGTSKFVTLPGPDYFTILGLGTVDGAVTFAKLLQLLAAFNAGTDTLTDNGDGTKTLTFKRQDGTAVLLDVRYNTASGVRTATTVH